MEKFNNLINALIEIGADKEQNIYVSELSFNMIARGLKKSMDGGIKYKELKNTESEHDTQTLMICGYTLNFIKSK